MDNSIYLFAAYGTLWIIIFLYLFRLARNQRKLREELDRIGKTVRRLRDLDEDKP